MFDLLDILQEKFSDYKIVSGGREFAVPCIFHPDHDHHLYINLRTGLFHCFVCQASGNWEKLANILGVDPKLVSFTPRAPQKREGVKLNDVILSLFTMECPIALLQQGFTQSVLRKHEIGFDYYRQRIVFPIRDIQGNLIGISGRSIYPDDQPKYRFYVSEIQDILPDYKFYPHKHLYHGHHVRRGKPLIIVEGFKACLWLVQHGWKNTVALMGASMTDEQALLLGSLSNDFILFLDNDDAGRRATKKIYYQLLDLGRVSVVLGPKRQPDDYTKEEIEELLSQRQSLLRLQVQGILSKS